MSAELSAESRLEIAHILFADIVGYSKLLSDEQRRLFQLLNEIVRDTPQFRAAEAADKLVRIATGDGMVLAFFTRVDAPVRCAQEISHRLREHPELKLRIGINSGPVDQVSDVNDQRNITGAGINMAQRLMDYGDAGHILLSRRVADDLAQYSEWKPYLHDLGPIEVKHGLKLDVVNFYDGELGNPHTPAKVMRAAKVRRQRIVAGAALLFAIASCLALWNFRSKSARVAAYPISDKSIAVLPFENLSAEQENAFFADGVQNEILTDLAKIADLKVISRTSVLIYKAGNPRNLREVGQQLGVAHVLEGSVQRAGGKVRVNAQLIDARTDKHLWAQTYDRDLSDVFTIETEIAQTIANELQVKLSAGERALINQTPTQNLAAYDLYVRAVSLVDGAAFSSNTEKDLFEAVDLLNRAVGLDPNFLLAYCWLARAHDAIYFVLPPPNRDHAPARLALAKSAIDSAFRLQRDSGEAHLAMGWHLYWGYFDYDHAHAEVELAAQTLPNSPTVFLLSGLMDRRQGRWAEAVRNLERASQLDPRNENTLINLITTYEMVRDYDKKRKALDRLQLLTPNDFRPRLARAAIERDERADLRPWRDELHKVVAENPKLAGELKDESFYLVMLERNFDEAASIAADLPEKNAFDDNGNKLGRDFYMGVVARLKGDTEGARSALTKARLQQEQDVKARPEDGQILCGLAMIDAELHRKEEALSEGRKAVDLISNYFFERPQVIAYFAMVCAQLGERDLAIEQLNLVANKPHGPTYGWLRLSPFWDPLRGDPRFEKIVASLAPKDTK